MVCFPVFASIAYQWETLYLGEIRVADKWLVMYQKD
jgi:hypothetical protein